MSRTIRAVFDGEVFRPDEPVELPPQTPVLVTVPTPPSDKEKDTFWEDILSIKVEGTPDWSETFEEELYGHGDSDQ